jgi:predicted RNA-binding protein
MAKSWLAVGSPKNWQRAFEGGNLWGLKEPQRNFWEVVEKGDRLFLYASTPTQGIVGVGTVTNKLLQTAPLWEEEVQQNKIIYPCLVEFQVDSLLPQDKWKFERLAHEVIKKRVKFRQTFQIVEEALAAELLASFSRALVASPTQKPVSLHDQIIEKLVKAGHLQKFIAEKEYDMEGTKLDAVWRKVEKAVPAYVFEVHIGGDLYQALSKLKHAFDIWNSNIFLVIQEKDSKGVDKLLSGVFHEIGNRLKIMRVSEVEELVSRKESLNQLEQNLGLL